MPDTFHLERFLEAQDRAGTYAAALEELRRGRKDSHWMWFVFPQVAGLGRSPTARYYAIGSLAEATAYLAHPVLGPRLREAAEAMLALPPGRSADEVLGGVDAVKLRSSMTLFHRADPAAAVFSDVIDRFYGGEPDAATDARL